MEGFLAYLGSRAKWAGKGTGGICGWVSLVTGFALAGILWCFPKWAHDNVSERLNAFAVGLLPVLAGGSVFLVRWIYSSYAVFSAERNDRIALEERLKSRILISAGRSVAKSVITADGITYFRARMDLDGTEPVYDVEAHITAIRRDGNDLQLDEVPHLMLHPGSRVLPALKEGVAGFVDVIKTDEQGRPKLALGLPYVSVNRYVFDPGHAYQIDVAVSGSTRTQKCTFAFNWTGDQHTAEWSVLKIKVPPRLG